MRIYLVTDQPFLALTLQDFCADLGHEVAVFSSGHDLLQQAGQGPAHVDLILLAFPLGSRECLQGLHAVRERYPEIPILLAGDHFPLPPDEALSLGVCGHLRYPLHLNELDFMLRRVSENQIPHRLFLPSPGGKNPEADAP